MFFRGKPLTKTLTHSPVSQVFLGVHRCRCLRWLVARINYPRFVYYFFKSVAPQIARMDVGSANLTLNRNHVHPMPIVWPPPRRAKSHRGGAWAAGRQDRVEPADERDAGGDGAGAVTELVRGFRPHPRQTRRPPPPAALFPEHLEDSPLGKKPIGWEVTALENVLAVLETGGRPKGGVGGITSGVPSIGAE